MPTNDTSASVLQRQVTIALAAANGSDRIIHRYPQPTGIRPPDLRQ